MNLMLKIRFYTDQYSWLCFKHAVELAVLGIDVLVEIDDFDSNYYTGFKQCLICEKRGEPI